MHTLNSFATVHARAMLRIPVVSLLFVTVILAISAPLTTAATVELKPGKYAFTVTYEVQDQRQNESRTGARCIVTADLDNPEKIFNDRLLASDKSEESCTVSGLQSGGGRISYDADCQNRLVHVEGTIANTEFSVVREVKPKASHGVSLKLTLMGKRTGDCDK
ncbi:MAG TPA: DUF3617 family protein [Candidatus Acidoferrales bacterium]|nr:DUF3617 family protein [Candidatus Acidoferrales bacterium]